MFEGQPLPVAQRALSEDELDQVVPDRRLAKQTELLRAYIDKQGRVVHVGRRMVRTLPPAPGKPAGEYYGFLTLPITPLSARLFSQADDADGRIVAWVDPDGPAAGRLQTGDRLTEINGVQIAVREKSGMKDEGPISVALVRGSAASEVRLTPDALPRKLVLVALLRDEPNAIAVEEGVAVTTGLIDLLPSDDALAFVVGHELAHISEGHVEKKITAGSVLKGIVAATVLVPANVALPGSGELLGAAIQGVQNRFNRDQERDADRLGVRYAQAAGYDPRAAIAFMELMAEKAPVGSVAQFLDVHPPYPERTELLRAEVAAAVAAQPQAAD